MAMSKQEKRKMCVGCRDNFYNGNNTLGVKECWNLKHAKVVERVCVGTWDPPPYVCRPERTLSCHRPKGMTWLNKSDVRVVSAEEHARIRSSKESYEKWLRN